MILGLLLGNTSLRYAIFDADSIHARGRIEWRSMATRGGEIGTSIALRPVKEVVAASVRDDLLPQLMSWIPSSLEAPLLAGRDFPLPIENRYLKPEETGVDRLLNALAARERARAQGSGALVVDFGTALSVSVVSPDGAFLGGLIGAGGASIQKGLEASTPRLPRVELFPPSRFLALDTISGLRAGVYWQLVGGARAILQGLLLELAPRRPRIFATGGEADLFSSAIPEIDEVVPDLALEGLRIACRSRGK